MKLGLMKPATAIAMEWSCAKGVRPSIIKGSPAESLAQPLYDPGKYLGRTAKQTSRIGWEAGLSIAGRASVKNRLGLTLGAVDGSPLTIRPEAIHVPPKKRLPVCGRIDVEGRRRHSRAASVTRRQFRKMSASCLGHRSQGRRNRDDDYCCENPLKFLHCSSPLATVEANIHASGSQREGMRSMTGWLQHTTACRRHAPNQGWPRFEGCAGFGQFLFQ